MSNAAAFPPRNMLPTSVPKVKNLPKFYDFDINQVGLQYFLFLNSQSCQKWKHDFEQHQKELIENKGHEVTHGCAYLHFYSCLVKAIFISCMVICLEFSLLLLPLQ